jgi:hypothetical protein
MEKAFHIWRSLLIRTLLDLLMFDTCQYDLVSMAWDHRIFVVEMCTFR